MLHAKQKELVVALTHLDNCDASLSVEGCMRVYERELDIGVGNVVALGKTRHVPEYVGGLQAQTGLDGNVTDEQVATGVYLEPDALGELTTKLQMACRRAYKKQLKLDDKKAAASSQIWPFGYFCLLVPVALFSRSPWWRRTHPYVVAALQAALFFFGWYVSWTLVALHIILLAHRGAGIMRVCCVCKERRCFLGCLECNPPDARAVVHATCHECVEGHLIARLDSNDFDGTLCCPCTPNAAGGCQAPAYEVASLARVVSAATFARFNDAVVARREAIMVRQVNAGFEDRVAAQVAAQVAAARDAIADDVRHIVDNILTLHCPACDLAFVDYDACALLKCHCGVRFCGFCLQPNATHEHVALCPENPLRARGEQGVYVPQQVWENAQHERKERLVRAHLAGATQEHRTAVLNHLRRYGMDIA